MKKIIRFPKRLLLASIVAILFLSYHFIFRPKMLDWNTPKDIQDLRLVGDVFTNGTRHTRAVLIHATPEKVWPWLIQIGQERGGFYSHQWLENLFQADMRNVYEIKSEFQKPREKGDTIWLANRAHYGGSGYQIVATCEPMSSLVMVGGEDYNRILRGEMASGSWAFYLHPAGLHDTWLIARSSGGSTSLGGQVLRYFTFEIPHFVMEKKMLKTIKHLVEE